MAKSMRFGRRLALPSTRQIRHELVMMSVREGERTKEAEDARAKLAQVPNLGAAPGVAEALP